MLVSGIRNQQKESYPATIGTHQDFVIGYSTGEPVIAFQKWKELVHPEDFLPSLEEMDRCCEGRQITLEVEYAGCFQRVGEWIWVHDRGEAAERDKNGRATLFLELTLIFLH